VYSETIWTMSDAARTAATSSSLMPTWRGYRWRPPPLSR
jgi:hypothetical protein